MGKFSERLSKRFRQPNEPIANWRQIGETFVLAGKIIDLGPDRCAAEILAFRAKFGKHQEGDLRAMFELFRALSQKQLEAAEKALQVLDRVDVALKPRLVR